MVLKHTYIRHRRSGFSLVEYLVALTMIVLIIATGAAVSENFMRAVAFLTNSVELDAKNRLAIDRMSREIRRCDAVQSAWSNGLVLRTGTNLTTFQYDPATRQLIRDHSAEGAEVYLRGCDYVRFDLFKRNPLTAPYNSYPAATTPTDCKIVQMTWVCSRRLLGFRATTGKMESARVVIRNQQDL